MHAGMHTYVYTHLNIHARIHIHTNTYMRRMIPRVFTYVAHAHASDVKMYICRYMFECDAYVSHGYM